MPYNMERIFHLVNDANFEQTEKMMKKFEVDKSVSIPKDTLGVIKNMITGN